ncbi:MAG: AlpA family phage regulatory protein [Siculibacillus sp.]|nr:AlpA family phage regulatory protein [Siculibacillus sp.]
MDSNRSVDFAGSGHGGGLPEAGLIRLASILAPKGPIPVGKSTWWDGVKSGRFPQPVKLGPRVTAWRVEDIRALVDRGV